MMEQKNMVKRTKIIALCGKGGVGKTSIAALMVGSLAGRGDLKILAIDADPAVGLCTALGIKVKKTVDDIRNDLINSVKRGKGGDRAGTLNMLDYEIFDAVTQRGNVGVLAIGRPEAEGCFCKVNSLLKDVIKNLAGGFDIVLIDGEAGVEQINRRVMEKVDCLIVVSDTSAKSVNVANTIGHLARDNKAVKYKSMGMILNRVRHKLEAEKIAQSVSMDILGRLPEDDLIREFDFQGKSFLDFPVKTAAYQTIESIIQSLQLSEPGK
jgi:CO dehydrogenase maturation factor